jgi:cullin 3
MIREILLYHSKYYIGELPSIPSSLPSSLSVLYLISFLHRTGYNLVLQKHGDMLYRGVSACFTSQTTHTLNQILSEPDEMLLSAILTSWEDHRTAIGMVRDIVMYLDRTYVGQHKLLPVYETGLLIFRNVILNHSILQKKLQTLLLTKIENERNGELIDQTIMKGVLNMLVELGVQGDKVYEREFETSFLTETKLYYQNESRTCLHQLSCVEYIQKVETRLLQEQKRSVNYLAKSTESKLTSVIELELISNHAETLVKMERSGCAVMLQENNIPNLKQLCHLFSRVPLKLQLIRDCISDFIKKTGSEILADQEKTKEKPVVFVENILALKDKFDQIILICLQVSLSLSLCGLSLHLSASCLSLTFLPSE